MMISRLLIYFWFCFPFRKLRRLSFLVFSTNTACTYWQHLYLPTLPMRNPVEVRYVVLFFYNVLFLYLSENVGFFHNKCRIAQVTLLTVIYLFCIVSISANLGKMKVNHFYIEVFCLQMTIRLPSCWVWYWSCCRFVLNTILIT